MTDPAGEISTVMQFCAEDLEFICRLHDREPDAGLLSSLARAEVSQWFGIRLDGEDAATGFKLMSMFLKNFAADGAPKDFILDELAADFTGLYLTFGKRIAPNESYWLTEDHIERQDPMFEVRKWYEHYGLKAENWRMRPDDHLVHEVEFVALLLKDGRPSALKDAGRFLDRHLLLWSKDFLGGVAQKASTPFYAGLALVTESLLQTVRGLIEQAAGEAREVPEPAANPIPSSDLKPDAPFIPGIEPSW